MFDLTGLPKLKAVYWRNLDPGMVYAGGVTIDGSVPPELREFPVLTPRLLDEIRNRYRFLEGRSVYVYPPADDALSPAEISDFLADLSRRVGRLNAFRSEFLSRKEELTGKDTAASSALESYLVRRDCLILDHWASGIRVFDSPGKRPSLLGDLAAAVAVTDVLTGEAAKKFRFPETGPFRLHVVADCSYSMKASGRDSIVRDTLAFFDGWFSKLFPRAEAFWYAFSDVCVPIEPRYSDCMIARRETRYETFVKKVLHDRTRDVPSTVLLFTDGVPTDEGASEALARFSRLGIDYTQIVFRIAEEGFGVPAEGVKTLDGYRLDGEEAFTPLPEDEQAKEAERERKRFTELAAAAGGNQIVLTLDRALGVVATEAFDRWLGAASMS